MATRIPLSPRSHAYDVDVEFGGVAYVMLVRWNWREGDWRFALRRVEDDVYVLTSCRISPGATWILPGGQIDVFGPDPYLRRDLGNALQVYWSADAELETARLDYDADPDFILIYADE